MNCFLKNISDDIFISEINLAGTHNSCAKNVRFGYISKCQDKTITQQLNMGIRFLDIRLEKKGNILKTVHAVTDCYKNKLKTKKILFSDVVDECKAFLKENPSEAVIICVKRDDGENDKATFEFLFEQFIKNDPVWYTENTIPKLSQVRGKLVLFNRFSPNENNRVFNDSLWGINASLWDHSGVVTDSAFSILPVLSTKSDTKTATLILQDKYKMSAKDKWEKAVLPTLSTHHTENQIVLNFLSTASIIKAPKSCAGYIVKQFESLTFEKNKKIGWIIFDYPTEEAIKKIYSLNF